MIELGESLYVPQLLKSLESLIKENSFVSRCISKIGRELHNYLLEDEESEFSLYFPVDCLVGYLDDGWSIDIEWLAEENGELLDDEGISIPKNMPLTISPVEHLAAFGIWTLSSELIYLGTAEQKFESNGFNLDGISKEQIINHRNSCVVLGFQALTAAQQFLLQRQSDLEQTVLTTNSRKAADARHAETRKLEKEAFEYWRQNIDPRVSNDEAAAILMKQIPLKLRTLSSYVSKFKKTVCMQTVQSSGACTAS
ncbi:hypothetical protein ABC383_07840 [Noviherbaspirillum sp. 1P10PC]|uniref:hypothetical protein n=1 Tax=Noviherbaspirillum sp. 1P10PC TaxID=3132292 RepID=UPI0039A12F08